MHFICPSRASCKMRRTKLDFMGMAGQSFSFFFCCQKKKKHSPGGELLAYFLSVQKNKQKVFIAAAERTLLHAALNSMN